MRVIRVLAMLLAVMAATAIGACARGPQIPASPAATVVPDVVFVPTPFPVVDLMLDVARVGPGDVLFDLGSGDGRIVIAAARRFGIRATGIDIDPVRIKESHNNADTAGVRHLVEFREADLFTTDLRPASVVTLYLLPALNVRLRSKLFEELRPGSRIVSHAFDMGDWKADSTMVLDSRVVYFWVMPANVSGAWTLTDGSDVPKQISIAQKYQAVVLTTGAGSTAGNAALRGDSITFEIDGVMYRGVVSGDAMQGSASRPGGPSGSWSARRQRSDNPA